MSIPRSVCAALLLFAVLGPARAQTPPEEQPFIEPAEHQHGRRHARLMAVQSQAGQLGTWVTLNPVMPLNPVHVALMHTGKVLVISGSGNDPDNHNFTAGVWNPQTQTITTFPIQWDMFCNGMVVLPDGRPFVMGGTIKYDDFLGQKRTATFSPTTETFTDKADMSGGRWYPTGTVLGNGLVMVDSGLNDTTGGINNTIQFYNPATNTFAPAGFAFGGIPLYPRQHVLPSGNVFESGSNATSKMYNTVTHTWTNVATTIFGQSRDYGTSVLLPLTPANGFKPKVIILGGGPGAKNVTATTETIDLSVASPAWSKGPDMVEPRVQLNATILPSGKVLVSGGSSTDEDITTAVLDAQLYDPDTNTFSPAGKMEFPRVYHSNTLLMPDATVMAVGGNPERKDYEPHIEIYSPAYLFKSDGSPAKRPVISSVTPLPVYYGGSFTIRTRDAAYIKSVVLVRAGAVTHAFDMDQRLVGLDFTVSGGLLKVKSPANGNLAPPGYYLLFIIDSYGVPSVGKFVRVTRG